LTVAANSKQQTANSRWRRAPQSREQTLVHARSMAPASGELEAAAITDADGDVTTLDGL
jgi:hypothetical protein